jgi:hypothetical protein
MLEFKSLMLVQSVWNERIAWEWVLVDMFIAEIAGKIIS